MEVAQRDWFSQDLTRALGRDLAVYAEGAALADLPTLSQLLCDLGSARSLTQSVIERFTAALRDEPLGEAPFRHSSTPGFCRLQMMQSGGVVLSLCAYEPVESIQTSLAVQFADCELHEILLAGSAQGYTHRLVEAGAGGLRVQSHAQVWSAGDTIAPSARTEARHFEGVENTLLVLQLIRTPPHPQPTREIRLSDGALFREASGDRKASEQVMALGVLGALGKPETLKPMREFARDMRKDHNARWEAVRQVLAMDTATGFRLLCELAVHAGDPIAQPARALKEYLEETEPALRALALEAS